MAPMYWIVPIPAAPWTHTHQKEASMTRLKQLFRRLDAFTLETFNPPHARRTR
jgi:hypothetical protein